MNGDTKLKELLRTTCQVALIVYKGGGKKGLKNKKSIITAGQTTHNNAFFVSEYSLFEQKNTHLE